MEFVYDKKKNQILFEQRGLTFEQAIEIIAEEGVLLDFQHPNTEEYPNQKIMVISIDHYPHCIPYVMDGEKFILKTIFKDRRFKYLLEETDED
ncbi:MAG: hypothetical protein B5M52_06290 [Helicobacteraceae bacterium 4484_230]|nr:MAG: hypothetical protein B5M52_06290 [Helicobacteraceae bacterium 4484_230]